MDHGRVPGGAKSKGEGTVIVNHSILILHLQYFCTAFQKRFKYQPQTPVKTDRLAELLQNYPDQTVAANLIQGFTTGFHLHYKGRQRTRKCTNLLSAREHPEVFADKVNKELQLGRYLGPFPYPPVPNLQCSPLGLVPKKGNKGKFRLIMHLSYPHNNSINSNIPTEYTRVKYKDFDWVVDLCIKHGTGCSVVKADLDSAYRWVPMSWQSLQYLGIMIEGWYLLETCLPFGAAESCAIFEKFSSALEWMVQEATDEELSHYLDDFIFVHASFTKCLHMLQEFYRICKEIGFPVNEGKTEGPTTQITFLGLLLDTILGLIRVRQDKVEDARCRIQLLLNSKKTKVTAVKSLRRLLNFICRAVRPGRAFIRRLYNAVGDLPKHYHISVTWEMKKDLHMWLTFIDNYNLMTPFVLTRPIFNTDLQLFTDSSANPDLGWGAYFQGQWNQAQWPMGFIKPGRSIALLELIPIVIALDTWAEQLQNKTIVFRSDNQAAVAIINKQSSRCNLCMSLVRHFVMVAMHHNITFQAVYLVGLSNEIADALSCVSDVQVPAAHTRSSRKPNTNQDFSMADIQLLNIPSCQCQFFVSTQNDFLLFVTKRQLRHQPFPKQAELYIAYKHLQDYSASTLFKFYSVLNYIALDMGYPDQATDWDVSKMMKTLCRQSKVQDKDTCLPINRELTFQILDTIAISHTVEYDKHLLQTCFACMYFGAFRAAEVTAQYSSKGTRTVPVQMEHVTTNGTNISMLIPISKTDVRPISVTLTPSRDKYCPVKLLKKFTTL